MMHLAAVAFVAGSLMQTKTGDPCTTNCGVTVPSGWGGFNDGDKNCEKCRCEDGALACKADPADCDPQPCESDVCLGKTACGGLNPSTCGETEACIDYPADDCIPHPKLGVFGRANCPGCCVENGCLYSKCTLGYECKLDKFGRAGCVRSLPVLCCMAMPVCPLTHTQAKDCTKEEFASGACVTATLCCTTITCRVNSQ